MNQWNGTIIGPGHSVHENRIYSLSIRCGPKYPDEPPEITFLTRINLPAVDQNHGKVDPNKLGVLANWKSTFTLETVLVELRRYVSSLSLSSHCARRRTTQRPRLGPARAPSRTDALLLLQGHGLADEPQAAATSRGHQLLSPPTPPSSSSALAPFPPRLSLCRPFSLSSKLDLQAVS